MANVVEVPRSRPARMPTRRRVTFAAALPLAIFAVWASYVAPNHGAFFSGQSASAEDALFSVGFSDSSAEPVSEIALATGDVADVYVSIAGAIPGVHDTFQLLVGYDEAISEVVSIECTGLFSGAFSPASFVETAPGKASIACGLEGGLAVADGVVAHMRVRRIGSGVGTLDVVADGAFATQLFSAGVPSDALPGAKLWLTEPTPASVQSSGGVPAPVNPAPVLSPPGAPAAPLATAGDGWAEVSWDPPAFSGSVPVTQYVVRSADGAVSQGFAVPPAHISGLQNGREYMFRVQAVNGIGPGPFSDFSNVVVPAGVPSAPVNLAALLEPSGVVLSWSPPEDSNGAAITSYAITESVSSIEPIELDAGALSTTVEGLPPGEYLFSVAAVNRAGTGPATTVEVSMPPLVSQPPESPVGESLFDGMLDIDVLRDSLRITLPAAVDGTEADEGASTGFSVGNIDVESNDGQPSIARLDLGGGAAIIGDVALSTAGDTVVMDLGNPILHFSPAVPTSPAEGFPYVGAPSFSTEIVAFTGLPQLSATVSNQIGPPYLPAAQSLRSTLLDLGWTVPTGNTDGEFIEGTMISIDHPPASSLELGDTTFSFSPPLTADLFGESTLLVLKMSDRGTLYARPATCQQSAAGPATCSVLFDGDAGGFSTFAVLNAQPVSQATPTATATTAPSRSPTATRQAAEPALLPTEMLPPTAAPPLPTPTITVLPINGDTGQTSLVVIIALASVAGLVVLGSVGYVINRRQRTSLSIVAMPIAAAFVTMLIATSTDDPAFRARAAGAIGGEGDVAQSSDAVRDAFGVDGAGVTIAIISDSYGCDSDALADDIASGEVPPDVTVDLDALPSWCDALSDRGRGIIQTIYDVAPGASFVFQTGAISKAQHAVHIRSLTDEGADIIVVDSSLSNEFFFQDDLIAQAIDEVTASGVVVIAPAGDDGLASYESAFTAGGTPPAVCSTTVPGLCTSPGTLHDFDDGPGVDLYLDVSIPGGASTITLQWDQPAGSLGDEAAASDLDLYVFDSSGEPVAVEETNNILSGDPLELANVSGLDTATVAISHRSGPEPGLVKLMFTNGVTIDEHASNSPTVVGYHNATGAISVNPVDYTNTPRHGGDPVPANGAPVGGTEVLFGLDGAVLDTPELRQKPDISAPSGAGTTVELPATSSAAANVAGAAALLMEMRPSKLDAEHVRQLLAQTAVDMGTPGFDLHSGHGLIDALAAAELLAAEPVANDDIYYVPMNGLLDVVSDGVLANDAGADGQTLAAHLVSSTSEGSLALNADGSFAYTPDTGFVGADSFSYLVNDGVFDSVPATVTIVVRGIESLQTAVTLQGVEAGADFGANGPTVELSDGVIDLVVSLAPAGAGEVSLTDLSPGNYELTAGAPGFLSASATVELGVVPGEVIVVPSILLPAGDADGDGDIDANDAAAVANAHGTSHSPGDRGDAAGNTTDLNGDGVTDGADLSLAVANIGKTGPLEWSE